LAVTALNSPVEQCWVSGKKHAVGIEVTNTGDINLTAGTNFTLGYQIDDNTPVTENFPLTNVLNADASFNYEFTDSITFPSGKVYTFKPFVKLNNDGDASNDTLLYDNTVNISAPVVNLGVNDTVYFTTTYEITVEGSYESYVWSTGAETSTIVVSETGTYSVTVTDDIGCEASGQIHCINRTTGIDDLIYGDGYTIAYYPNPVSDRLKVEIKNQFAKDVKIDLINIQGQILYINQYSRIQNTIEEIDISQFAKGVYYIRFSIEDAFYVRKLIIQ
jgi:hypothetical protein